MIENEKVDAVIVGAGGGGGCIAKELTAAGLSVVMFERGPQYSTRDFMLCHDEMYNKDPRLRFRADSRFVMTSRDTEKDKSMIGGPWLGYGVGGATNVYGAQSWRWREVHFKMKSTYGQPEGSSLEDWPITYDDLEPFYDKAEYDIGVCGKKGANSFEAPRKREFPLPPIFESPSGEWLAKAERSLGLHPFPVPLAVLTEDYRGRKACIRHRQCVGKACPVRAKGSTSNSVIPMAVETGNCEVRPECYVTEILMRNATSVRGVTYVDNKGIKHIQEANVVVVAASAIETPRLLLLSKNKYFPDGIGNQHDQVGRNVMGHAAILVSGVTDQKFEKVGPGSYVSIDDYNATNPDILGGSQIQEDFRAGPITFSKSARNRIGWGSQHKNYVRKYFLGQLELYAPIEEIPVETNRVDLDPDVTDHWGLPAARITHVYHPAHWEVVDYMNEKCIEILETADCLVTSPRKIRSLRRSVTEHCNGSCRMGTDPHSSVVDINCKVHGVDNLFIGDTSVFVTSAGYNPALHCQAVAYRTAAGIIMEWRGTQFR